MKSILLVLFAVSISSVLGCEEEQLVPPAVPEAIPFIDLGDYTDCFHVPDSGNVVITVDSLYSWYYDHFWECYLNATDKRPPPSVDFSRDMIIAVFHGDGMSGCSHKADVIRSIYRLRDTIHVAVDKFVGSPVCLDWVFPLQMVTIPKSTLPVVFEKYVPASGG